MLRFVPALLALALAPFAGCTVGSGPPPPDDAGRRNPVVDGRFTCLEASSEACIGAVHWSCTASGEFLQPVMENCADRGLICAPGLWCVTCLPGSLDCDAMGNAVRCSDDGTTWLPHETCDLAAGRVCDLGRCISACEQAIANRSYIGCEFYAADLDNAAIGAGRDASSQQYAIVVSNPGNYPTDVTVEIDVGPFGGTTDAQTVAATRVLPGDLEILELPRREVDGASNFAPCAADAECVSASQQCWCTGGVRPGPGAADCRCRSSATGSGMNDGTHSALTAHAYRVRSVLPIVAYQFNPLDNVGVFSNDASLLVPTSGIERLYTVVGWPQTIADSTNPAQDFDPSTNDEDLRAFLTVIGTQPATHLRVTFGAGVGEVVGTGPYAGTVGHAGDLWEFDLGELDVVNLETHHFNADFTGTIVEASLPVSVFVGSEASDAPRFDDLANRQCCADHLEEQLFADDSLGGNFYIGRTPRRSHALNQAFLDPTRDSVGEFNEPEYVRMVAVAAGTTHITTTIPPPDDYIELTQGASVIVTAAQDFRITADQPIAVLQVIPSQEATGIPYDYPGGDPSIIGVSPVQQWRQDYVFLTPNLYAFDFVTVVAARDARILLDEMPIEMFACDVGAADGLVRQPADPPPDFLVYRCQLSFPDVIGRPNVRVEDGIQNDGYHSLRTDDPNGVSLVVTGYDAYVSYGYAGGANLHIIR